MLPEQTTLFRISDYEVVDSKLGLSDWELENECTDSTLISNQNILLMEGLPFTILVALVEGRKSIIATLIGKKIG
jgi:hypothetical protein